MLGLKEELRVISELEELKAKVFNKIINDNIDEIKEFEPTAIINTKRKFHSIDTTHPSARFPRIFSVCDVSELNLITNVSYEDRVIKCLKERVIDFITGRL